MPRVKTVSTRRLPARVIAELVGIFRRNGYIRRQNVQRLKKEGYMGYKKGDEVRLVAQDKRELRTIQRLLRAAGFKPGRPFAKGRKYCQPLYGREAVARFLQLLGERKKVQPRQRAKKGPS